MKGKFFRTLTILCTIILVLLIVTGCVDFAKLGGLLTGLLGTAGQTARQNLDSLIKVIIGIAIGVIAVKLWNSRNN